VQAARKIQTARYGSPLITNASASKKMLDTAMQLSPAAREEMSEAIESLALSGRGLDRVVRVSRTFADLEGSEWVTDEHVFKALSFRTMHNEAGAAA
jgi:magnesium chelatase family protein